MIAAAAGTLGCTRQRDALAGGEAGNAGDDRNATLRRVAAGAENLDLLVERERRGLSE